LRTSAEIQSEKHLVESWKTVIRCLAGTVIIPLAAKLRMALWITHLPLKLADLGHTVSQSQFRMYICSHNCTKFNIYRRTRFHDLVV